MINHYLLTLTAEQEDRVLTHRLGRAPTYYNKRTGCGCLVGTVLEIRDIFSAHDYEKVDAMLYGPAGEDVVGIRFDELCERFGEERVNAAIRNRILSNRARRTLRHPQLQETA